MLIELDISFNSIFIWDIKQKRPFGDHANATNMHSLKDHDLGGLCARVDETIDWWPVDFESLTSSFFFRVHLLLAVHLKSIATMTNAQEHRKIIAIIMMPTKNKTNIVLLCGASIRFQQIKL